MSNSEIPDTHHVARHAGGTKLEPDGRPNGAAFFLRPTEARLSANWLEFPNPTDREKQLERLCAELRGSGRKLGTRSRFAVLNVGRTCATVRARTAGQTTLAVHHDPLHNLPSHAAISGYTHELQAIADMIADTVVATYPAVEPV